MLRILGYIALVLAPLIVLLILALVIGIALFGLAVVRSDTFEVFAVSFVAFAIAASVTAGIVLARAPRDRS